MPRPRRILEFKPLFTNLAQNSHFQVYFNGLQPELLTYLSKRGVDARFIAEDAGLLCYSAQLPTTQMGTASITGNFMGVTEKFAHTRIFSEITLDFYIDRNYKALKFLEHWMEFIASGNDGRGVSLSAPNYSYRMQYPSTYKSNATRIVKFERDYGRELEYNFINLFPLNISSIPVAYTASDKLTATVTFQFDRYVAGRVSSFDVNRNTDNNKEGLPRNILPQPQSADDISTAVINAQQFSPDTTGAFNLPGLNGTGALNQTQTPIQGQTANTVIGSRRVF